MPNSVGERASAAAAMHRLVVEGVIDSCTTDSVACSAMIAVTIAAQDEPAAPP